MGQDSPIGKAASGMVKLANFTDPAMFIANRSGEFIEKTLGYYGPSSALKRIEEGKSGQLDPIMDIMAGGPPPDPEKEVDPLIQEVGDEGVRRGALSRAARKKEISQLYLTRGSRSNDSTLGGYLQNLGG